MNTKFEDIIKKLKAKDYRLTDIRKAVIRILTDNEHVSINDIVATLQTEVSETINIMSIYNTIDLLMAEHIIHANVFEGKQIVYELSENSIHIICNSCNKNIHVPVVNSKKENLSLQLPTVEKIAKDNNFSFSHYKVEIHGICEKCQLKAKNIKF